MFVGGVPAIVNRLSFTGELGYEIYVSPHYHLKLYEEIINAGESENIKNFGSRALMSMRMEKNWGAWALDFRHDFTAKETGLDKFINWDKDFVGKEKLLNLESPNKLVCVVIDSDIIDVTGDEAVIKNNDECIGYITSGGYAHYIKKSMAFAYINKEKLSKNDNLKVEINGKFYNASIQNEPLYDKDGFRMRS